MARAIPTIGFEAYHHDAIYVYQPNAVTHRHLERAGMTAREVPIADIPLPWSKVILQQDYETLLHTQRYLLERWGEHYEAIFSNRVLLELTRKGSSKGGMVQYLARTSTAWGTTRTTSPCWPSPPSPLPPPTAPPR